MTRISRIVGVADIHRAATFDPSPPTVNSQYALLGRVVVAVGLRTFGAGVPAWRPEAWGLRAPGEVGGSQHAFACCCPGPGGPGRGQRSDGGGALAM